MKARYRRFLVPRATTTAMPVFRLIDELVFPPPVQAENGLLAVGGDLCEARLLLAYRMGIFPWYCSGEPILWWSPDPRLILLPDEFHVSRRLERTLRIGRFTVTLDQAFRRVVEGCASAPCRDQDGTWITREMKASYCRLHRSGYAHSVECWEQGELAGGLYGVSLGRCFFGESMFSRVPNASKVALARLVEQLKRWRFDLIDCQVTSVHLLRLGAREVSRAEFLQRLQKSLAGPTRVGFWSFT